MSALELLLLVLLAAAAAAVLTRHHLRNIGSALLAACLAATLAACVGLFVEPLATLGFFPLAVSWGAAAATDLATRHLPDILTLAPLLLFFLLLLPWLAVTQVWSSLGRSLIGALATAMVLFVIAYINPGGFGLGDVKLGLTTGAALGWFGIGTALLGIAAAFILMAVISGALLVTKRIRRDAQIPFGPFMILGVLVAPFAANLLGW